MYQENDYILRLIHEVIRTLIKLIFGVDVDDNQEEKVPEEIRESYKKLLAMADDGKINEAENLLSDSLDLGDIKKFQLALLFYEYLNKKEDGFLEEHGYSRQEVLEGLKYTVSLYGYGSMMGAFTEDLK